jgi:hypothetical protein
MEIDEERGEREMERDGERKERWRMRGEREIESGRDVK